MTARAPVVFLAWQDAVSRAWYPIGRLELRSGRYRFVYIRGFERAQREAGLVPLIGFPEVDRVYESDALFPLFANRLMSREREDYDTYLERLALPDETGPLAILARSAGRRTTDSLEVFAHPLVEDGAQPRFHLDFFVHGLRHMPAAAEVRALELEAGSPLFLMLDPQNVEDPRAVGIRSEDRVLLGYLPRYFCADVSDLLTAGAAVTVEVARINPPPAPVQHRVLVTLDAPWGLERRPFAEPDYQPIPDRDRGNPC